MHNDYSVTGACWEAMPAHKGGNMAGGTHMINLCVYHVTLTDVDVPTCLPGGQIYVSLHEVVTR